MNRIKGIMYVRHQNRLNSGIPNIDNFCWHSIFSNQNLATDYVDHTGSGNTNFGGFLLFRVSERDGTRPKMGSKDAHD